MANYNKATNFTAKDTLPTGNAGKIIKGTEIDNEFTAIASAITSKSDSNSPNFTGTPTVPTATLGTNNTQIASTAFIQAAINALLPTGVITMWSGAITSIPTGWYLCDGQNSTPDLRGKFIIGAGGTDASVTGTAGASVTGSISGTTLTVSAVANGTIAVGDIVSHPSILETATISGLGTGTGGTGTYTLTYTGSTSSFVGSISGTTMTVTEIVSGSIIIGQVITGTNVTAGTTVTSQISGTTGGVGTYTVSVSQTTGTLASVTASISGTTLTVTAVASGALAVGQVITGTGVAAGTKITALGTGTGGTGTYTVSVSQTVTSRAMTVTQGTITGSYVLASTSLTINSTVLRVTVVASGTLSIGQFLTGTGVAFSTSITAFGTGSGNTGTYTLSSAQYFASTTVTASAGTVTVGATGGSKDAVVVSHTHTATVNDPGHIHSLKSANYAESSGATPNPRNAGSGTMADAVISATTGITVSNSTTGSSGTNANLPPYYALAYIMKA
jgi:hypothetical protein